MTAIEPSPGDAPPATGALHLAVGLVVVASEALERILRGQAAPPVESSAGETRPLTGVRRIALGGAISAQRALATPIAVTRVTAQAAVDRAAALPLTRSLVRGARARLAAWEALGAAEESRSVVALGRAADTTVDLAVPAVMAQVDVTAVVEQVVTNVDVTELLDTILRKVPLDPIVDRVFSELDLEALINRVLDEIDMGTIVERVLASVDLAPIVEGILDDIDISAIVAQASGGVAADMVDRVRIRGVQGDDLVDRILRRKRPEVTP